VAQEVLEYLGVPHDHPLKAKKATMIAAAKNEPDDAPADSTADLNAMFDQVNDLPADDPLRARASGAATPTQSANAQPPATLNTTPSKATTPFRANTDASRPQQSKSFANSPPAPAVRGKGAAIVNASDRVSVPSFAGGGLRRVVERADAVGLRVRAVGDGLARDQVPVAGTMVPLGTEVVVKFTR
jgi:cell division protein FtsI (penicillin-binding protein 3)